MLSFSLFIASILPVADGHAFIYYPPLRGGARGNPDNAYCPHCLGSTSLPMPTCGNSKFLSWTQGPVTTIEAGSKLQIHIRVTAHHKGHFMFRLCDQVLGANSGGLQGEEECLNRHVLKRVRPEEIHDDCQPNDRRGDCQPYDEANPSYWYLPPPSAGDAVLLQGKSNLSAGAEYKFHYWIPADVTCEKCTLQWWWMSANSGTPDPDAYACYFQKMAQLGWNANSWWGGGGSCPTQQRGYRNVGEQFKNCADVRIIDTGRGGSMPTPAQTPTPGIVGAPSPTPPVGTPPRRRRGAPTTGSSCTGQPCLSTSHCRSKWGYCGSSSDYCNGEATWAASCNAPPTQAPEPEPESESEAESESESKSESEAETEMESETETEAEKEAEAESESEAEAEKEGEAESESETEKEAEAESESESEGESEHESESETEGGSESETTPTTDVPTTSSKVSIATTGKTTKMSEAPSSTMMTSSSTTIMPEEPSTTTEDTVAPTQAPTSAKTCPGQPCGSASLCRSKWGHCGYGAPWCNSESTWKAGGCGNSMSPAPAPRPPAVVSVAPSPSPQAGGSNSGARCSATPGMNNGVSDSSCAQCTTGYQWWPCNQQSYCTCSSACSWSGYWTCGGALNEVQAKRRLRAVSRHHPSIAGNMLLQNSVGGSETDAQYTYYDDEADEEL